MDNDEENAFFRPKRSKNRKKSWTKKRQHTIISIYIRRAKKEMTTEGMEKMVFLFLSF